MTPRTLAAWTATALLATAACTSAASAAPPSFTMLVTKPTHRTSVGMFDLFGWMPLYLVNHGGPLRVEISRTGVGAPWRAVQVTDGVASPVSGAVHVSQGGFGRALSVVVRDARGHVVHRRDLDLCLNDGRLRMGPAGTAVSAFPDGCSSHPFARGVLVGVGTDEGSPVPVARAVPPRLGPGRYRVVVTVRPAVADLLRLRPAARSATLRLRIDPARAVILGPGTPYTTQVLPLVTFHGSFPGGTQVVPQGARAPEDTQPNLVAVPAFDISVRRKGRRDELWFAATVWNAGPGPMIVEGFRRGSAPFMDGYQFFRRGREDVASSRVGRLDYDRRPQHDHWHFRDFAQYSLVRPNGRPVARSPKEAWCLAPTDQIDQLVPNAEMHPGVSLLSAACGDPSAAQVREVLEVGAGDTYGSMTPGQAIAITRVPNGRYMLKIAANPVGNMQEVTADDNVALRPIILGGRPGARWVKVPRYRGVDIP